MKHLLVIAALAMAACNQPQPEAEVTTDTTAAAVSGQETTPKSAVTTETTAAAVQQGGAGPSAANAANAPSAANPAPVAPNAPPAAANLMLDPKKSQPAGCERLDCPKGTQCMLVEVQCVQAPCPPQPECRPETEVGK